MRVTMKTKIGGYRNGEPWPEIGGTIDLTAHEARDLIANGYAAEHEESDDDDQAPADVDGAPAEDGDGDTPADGDDETAEDEWFDGDDPAADEVTETPRRRRRAGA